jgi:hypothetical protein
MKQLAGHFMRHLAGLSASGIIRVLAACLASALSVDLAAADAPTEEALRTQFFKLCELSMAEMEKPLAPFYEKYRQNEEPTTRHYPFFMESYAIRPLCVAYDMTGEKKYLDACTRWADEMVEFQRRMTPKGAYYLNYGAFRRPDQDHGQWFVADSGSIAAAVLAVAIRTKDAQQRETYLASIRAYARLTIDNYVSVGSGVTDGLWSYKGEWWASTAIFGSFMFLAHAETKDPEYLKVGLGCVDWLNKCDFLKGNPPAVDAVNPCVIFYCGECYALALPHIEKGTPRREKAEAQLAVIQKWLADNQKGRGAKTEWNYFDMGKVYMPGNPYFMYILSRQSPQYRELAAEADREMAYVGELLFKDGRPPRSTDLEHWGLMTFGMMSYAERLAPGALMRVSP